MKLIDLLAKELPKRGGWPKGAAFVAQEEGGGLWSFTSKPQKDCDGEWMDESHDGYHTKVGKIPAASDHDTSTVTRTQYESALAASDGWIEWGGGECPVHGTVYVDVKLRSGHVTTERRAYSLDWNHYTPDGDGAIIAYRLHSDIESRANDDLLEQYLNECIGQGVDMPEWNGEGLPPVGCACEMQDSKGTWLPVDIIAKNDGFTFGWSYDCRIVLFGDKTDEFRPLRTEAEKLREKLAASLHIAAGASPIELNGIGPLYFKLADSIISGSVFGTTFKVDK